MNNLINEVRKIDLEYSIKYDIIHDINFCICDLFKFDEPFNKLYRDYLVLVDI